MKPQAIALSCLLGLLLAVAFHLIYTSSAKPAEYMLAEAITSNLSFDGLVDSGISVEDVPVLNVENGESIFVADASINDFGLGFVFQVGNTWWYIPEIVAEWHPIINIKSGGETKTFTYDLFCRSGNLISDSVNYTGLFYEGNALLESDSDYFWQLSGKSVISEDLLSPLEYKTMTWDEFKDDYPAGRAVSLRTGFDRDYGRHPYGGYLSSNKLYFPTTSTKDAHEPKDLIYYKRNAESIAITEGLETEQAFWHCLHPQFDTM